MQFNICGKPLLRIECRKAIEASKPKVEPLRRFRIFCDHLFGASPYVLAVLIGMMVGVVVGANTKMNEIRQMVRDSNGTLVLHVSMLPLGNPVAESANIWDLDANKIVQHK